MKYSLQQIADAVQARLRGDGSIQIRAVASVVSAKQDDLVFVEHEKYLAQALKSAAGAVIAGEFAAAATPSSKPLLMSPHPKLAFARAARFLARVSVQVPVVVGWLRPAVLVPVGALAKPEVVPAA